MDAPALNHLLRTMAAVAPSRRVLVRGTDVEKNDTEKTGVEKEAGGHVSSALAQMGFEVHAAPWTDDEARQVHRAAAEGEAPAVYTTGAPVGALPYPEAHFAWVIVQVPRPDEAAEALHRRADLRALLAEARRHVRPGGWVFVLAPAAVAPDALDEVAAQAALAEAEAPERDGRRVRGIYRRVEEETAP